MMKLVLVLAAFEGASAFALGGTRASVRNARASVRMEAGIVSSWGIQEVSPDGKLIQRVEGSTRKTWKFNDLKKDSLQVAVDSEGRPINADVQLWMGPNWTPFTLKAYSEDGKRRPIQTLIGTRNKEAMIEVRNNGQYEFPIRAAANYAKGAMIRENPSPSAGTRVDGGALKSFPVSETADQLELVLNTDGKQLNARVEVLDGPNNPKQTYEVFTNNGELNALKVCFNIPDSGNTLRIINLAPVEFPCYIHLNEITATDLVPRDPTAPVLGSGNI